MITAASLFSGLPSTSEPTQQEQASLSGPSGIGSKYFTPMFNPMNKVVILYSETYGWRAARDIEAMGGLVVQNIPDLINLVK